MIAYLRLLRPWQWAKNMFVAAPLFFGLELFNKQSVLNIAVAVMVFCLLSSAVYVFNDLRDRALDALHPKKRARPLAAGTVSPTQALVLSTALAAMAAGLALAFSFQAEFYACLAFYFLLSLAYSLGLKRVNLVELFIVASGYVLRVLAGCAAIGVQPSPWILSATGVLALLIVTGKRRSDMARNPALPTSYDPAFLDNAISVLGAATIVTYLLFTASDYAMQRYGPYVIGTSIFVVYGVLRYIQRINAGDADDPTTLVLSDPGIRLCVALWAATFFALIYLH